MQEPYMRLLYHPNQITNQNSHSSSLCICCAMSTRNVSTFVCFKQDLKKSELTASEEDLLLEDLLTEDLLTEDLLIEDLLIENLLIEDLLIEDLLIEELLIEDLLIEDLALEDYHFDDCEKKAHLFIDYFANINFERQLFARGY
jgi:hypothetical protein